MMDSKYQGKGMAHIKINHIKRARTSIQWVRCLLHTLHIANPGSYLNHVYDFLSIARSDFYQD